ncbi:hypothetical protein CSOJ01_16036, partial [Colletotrichum sojae]
MYLDRELLAALVDFTISISHVFVLVRFAEFYVEDQDVAFELSWEILSGIQNSDRLIACPPLCGSSAQEPEGTISADAVSGDTTSTPTYIDLPTISETSDLPPRSPIGSTTPDKSETHILKVLIPRRWLRNWKPEPVDAYLRTPPAEEQEDLALVSSLWDIYCRQVTYELKRVPSALMFQLVTVPSAVPSKGDKQSRDHICITGFYRWSGALRFHAIMAKKENARLYRPLRLCYRLSSVDEAALSGVFTETPRSDTLCGTPVLVKSVEGLQWTCTIGGLIEVGNQRFGLTTTHRPSRNEDDDDESDFSDDVSSDSSWSLDYENDDFEVPGGDSAGSTDGDPALDCVGAEQDCIVQPSIDSDGPISLSHETYSKGSNDWELISVDLAQQLPNIIPATEVGTNPNRGRGIIRDHVDMKSWNSKKRPVHSVTAILRGARLCHGRVRREPSYLATPSQGIQQVWTVEFDGEGAKLGDSGSWVVEDDSGQLFGTIVARAPGLGFVVPFDHVRQSIARSMDLNLNDVRLPMPEQAEITHIGAVIAHPEEMHPELQLTANRK